MGRPKPEDTFPPPKKAEGIPAVDREALAEGLLARGLDVHAFDGEPGFGVPTVLVAIIEHLLNRIEKLESES